MAKTVTNQTETTFRARVTGRHAITLPAVLCRMLGIENGDSVELAVHGQHAVLRKVDAEPSRRIKGLLADYFTSRDDVEQFLEEERRGWAERDERLGLSDPSRG